MMRLIAMATVFGALTAGGSWYATSGSTAISAVDATPHTAVAETAADAAWPICTTMTALGNESDWAQLDPDFAAGKRALAMEDWGAAIRALDLALLRDPLNADILNYIGYAHARLRQPGPAMGHYQQALMINPRHRGARTHLGELFLALGEPSKAQEQLVALKEICLISCDEVAYLEHAIDTGMRRPILPE